MIVAVRFAKVRFVNALSRSERRHKSVARPTRSGGRGEVRHTFLATHHALRKLRDVPHDDGRATR